MKRIVTGHDESGKSIFISVGEPIRVADLGAVKLAELWATDKMPQLPDNSVDPEVSIVSLVPEPGGTRFRIFTLAPPDPHAAAPTRETIEALLPALREALPGLGDKLEPDDPSMHTTDTLDYIVVVSGEADLELDDGQSVHVEPGDCVIQRGPRHAWRVTGHEPFVAAAIMIGARRAEKRA